MTKRSLPLAFLASLPGTFAVNCTYNDVLSIMPTGVSLSFATPVVENGTFTVPEGDTGWPINPINLPKLCAIGATVPFDQSNETFGFGLFLPDKWNGRTLYVSSSDQPNSLPLYIRIILTKFDSTVGNGGLAGGVNWADMVRKM